MANRGTLRRRLLRVAPHALTAVEILAERAQPYRQSHHEHFDYHSYFDYREETEEFGGIIPYLFRQLKRLIKFLSLLALSMLSYHCFYRLAMPTFSVLRPLFFDYSGSPPFLESNSTAALLTNEPQTDIRAPWASVDLFARHSWQVGTITDAVVPSPRTSHRLLASGGEYFLELMLSLPESRQNREATGMFMLAVELGSSNNTLLATSRRSAMFPYQSEWIRMMQKVLLAVPFLVGALKECRSIVVPVFRHYVESREFPLRFIRVYVIPERESHSIIQIDNGEVRMGKEFTLFQSFLREWYFTCFTIGTMLFMIVYSMVWVMLVQSTRRQGTADQSTDDFSSYSENDPSHDGRRLIVDDEERVVSISDDHVSGSGTSEEWEDMFYDANSLGDVSSDTLLPDFTQ